MINLSFLVDAPESSGGPVAVPVSGVYNFGYAGRDQESVREHVRELQDRGVPAPKIVPALYPMGADGVTTGSTITVFGDQTYGEVEYALINSAMGWLVTVASDHTDAVIETASVSRAKRCCPDVLAGRAWRLADVADRFDELELVSEYVAGRNGGAVLVQRGLCGTLLAPATLLEILTHRLGRRPPDGTLILSGTIGGDPPPGMEEWHMRLHDPGGRADLRLNYHVSNVPDELG